MRKTLAQPVWLPRLRGEYGRGRCWPLASAVAVAVRRGAPGRL